MKKQKINFKKLVYLGGGSKKWQIANSKTADSERWIHHILPADAEAPYIEEERKQTTFLAVFGLSLLIMVVLAGQLVNLQLFQGASYLAQAEGNRIKEKIITAARGIIYDANGIALVENIASYDLSIIPGNLPLESLEKENVLRNLSAATGISYEEIAAYITEDNQHSTNPIVIKSDISKDAALLIESEIGDLAGVNIDISSIRHYLDNSLLSQVLGYVGKISSGELEDNNSYSITDSIGKSGLEQAYESLLKGVNGAESVEVDSSGDTIASLGVVDAEEGSSIKLSIDLGLQDVLTNALKAQMTVAEVDCAAAVAVNPQTGEILSMVSLPSYDNNLFSNGISSSDYSNLINDDNQPLLNRAVSGEYPSGSTIKPFIAAAALEEGTITDSTTVNSTGGITIGSYTYPDWKSGGHGVTDVYSAIAMSVNTFFYAIGGGYGGIEGLGADRMKMYLEKFGFGRDTGINLTGESDGNIPNAEWKLRVLNEQWYLGDTYHMAIGQGDLLVTPLQMAMATAAIANGGTLYEPTLVSAVLDSEGNVVSTTSPIVENQQTVSSETIQIIQNAMRQTVTSGSARSLNSLSKAVSGKTGTAQYGNGSTTHAWFITYGPTENPTIAVAILLEGAGGGDVYAVPVAKTVYEWYFANR